MRQTAIVLLLAAVGFGGSAEAGEPAGAPSPRAFLKSFQRAVAAHRWDEVVGHFSRAYVSAQLDQALGGRSGQFLVEALGLADACPGYAANEPVAKACLDRVCAKRVRAAVEGGGAELPASVTVELEPRCGEETVAAELILVHGPAQGGQALALAGPVG